MKSTDTKLSDTDTQDKLLGFLQNVIPCSNRITALCCRTHKFRHLHVDNVQNPFTTCFFCSNSERVFNCFVSDMKDRKHFRLNYSLILLLFSIIYLLVELLCLDIWGENCRSLCNKVPDYVVSISRGICLASLRVVLYLLLYSTLKPSNF